MNYLIKNIDTDTLDELIKEHDIEVVYKARHIPYVSIASDLQPNQLQELLPDYEIQPEKTYTTPEDIQKD